MSNPIRRSEAVAASQWPSRVIALASRRLIKTDGGEGREVLGELWTLVHLGLARYVRQHALRLGPVDPEDVRDIAAEKALELIRRLESGAWDPSEAEPAQLCAFLSILARNGLVDHLRARSPSRTRALHAPPAAIDPEPRPSDAPSRALCRILFPRALVGCLAPLSPRARRIWLLRTFHELPSKTIARHPDVRTSSAAVDMTLARVRVALARCLRRKGFDLRDLPTGTFAAAWEAVSRVPRP